MPVDRPTFSESWYRVASLRPRLRSTVQIHRQHFRGQMWHVIQDPASNQFFRLNDAAYYFVALLDGRRSVSEVWQICNEELGDAAPTQGEAIQLLGQLYTSNLLQSELPPDAAGLFKRYQKRVRREVQGYLTNLLFIRIPLFDPERFLEKWVGVFGKVFTWFGAVALVVLLAIGGYFVVGNFQELVSQGQAMFSQQKLGENLPLLYLGFVFVKMFHEFGHAFACKKFGKDTGSSGEVHTMGVMFLVFMPLPYVDASSAWAFASKWRRVVVGAAGMLVELGVAAIAAIVWARTDAGVVHALAYNVMFIASVSTLLFNGNPLLRFDGYYILSDLLEIPNLWNRSRQYLYYLVRRRIWRVRRVQNPAHSAGEKAWLFTYGLASTIYRFFIVTRILMFVVDKLFFLGLVLAGAALIGWVMVPLGKFLRYLFTSGELARLRAWAVGSTVFTLVAVIAAIGLIPSPDRVRLEGVVEPVELAFVHAESAGFVVDVLVPTGREVAPGTPLLTARNEELLTRRDSIRAEIRRLDAKRRIEVQAGERATVQATEENIEARTEDLRDIEEQIDALTLRAPIGGTWVSPNIRHLRGGYLERGQKVGLIVSLDNLLIRSTAGQDSAGIIIDETGERDDERYRRVEVRVKGRPDQMFTGRIAEIYRAADKRLPSAALGYPAGGGIPVSPEDQQGMQAAEGFFEVRIVPDDPAQARLLSGQRVVIRLDLPEKPLAAQWGRSLLQLIQQRFRI